MHTVWPTNSYCGLYARNHRSLLQSPWKTYQAEHVTVCDFYVKQSIVNNTYVVHISGIDTYPSKLDPFFSPL